jgi:hypothetical protein
MHGHDNESFWEVIIGYMELHNIKPRDVNLKHFTYHLRNRINLSVDDRGKIFDELIRIHPPTSFQ